jgi:hypothetical protein
MLARVIAAIKDAQSGFSVPPGKYPRASIRIVLSIDKYFTIQKRK